MLQSTRKISEHWRELENQQAIFYGLRHSIASFPAHADVYVWWWERYERQSRMMSPPQFTWSFGTVPPLGSSPGFPSDKKITEYIFWTASLFTTSLSLTSSSTRSEVIANLEKGAGRGFSRATGNKIKWERVQKHRVIAHWLSLLTTITSTQEQRTWSLKRTSEYKSRTPATFGCSRCFLTKRRQHFHMTK
jgi:hypothetical protein